LYLNREEGGFRKKIRNSRIRRHSYGTWNPRALAGARPGFGYANKLKSSRTPENLFQQLKPLFYFQLTGR
jgi:hypothetical protein